MKFYIEQYHDAVGNNLFARELKHLTKIEIARIVAKLGEIAENGYTPKNYKRFKGYAFNVEYGEFIIGDFRLLNLFYDGKFIILRLFRKQSNETPQREKDLGWQRAIDYLSRQKP